MPKLAPPWIETAFEIVRAVDLRSKASLDRSSFEDGRMRLSRAELGAMVGLFVSWRFNHVHRTLLPGRDGAAIRHRTAGRSRLGNLAHRAGQGAKRYTSRRIAIAGELSQSLARITLGRET